MNINFWSSLGREVSARNKQRNKTIETKKKKEIEKINIKCRRKCCLDKVKVEIH
jgi:hypothetical protein